MRSISKIGLKNAYYGRPIDIRRNEAVINNSYATPALQKLMLNVLQLFGDPSEVTTALVHGRRGDATRQHEGRHFIKKVIMNKKIVKQTLYFVLLLFPLLGSSGCPLAMDYWEVDSRLQAINQSDTKILFAVKDSVEGILAWAGAAPKSQTGIGLTNFKWDQILSKPTDSIKVYCIEYSKWDQSKGWDEINGKNSLKHSVYTRAQLDSAEWKVIYP